MWPKLNQKTASVSSVKMCFNGANTSMSNNWNKCKIYRNKINELIKYIIQKPMKLAVI